MLCNLIVALLETKNRPDERTDHLTGSAKRKCNCDIQKLRSRSIAKLDSGQLALAVGEDRLARPILVWDYGWVSNCVVMIFAGCWSKCEANSHTWYLQNDSCCYARWPKSDWDLLNFEMIFVSLSLLLLTQNCRSMLPHSSCLLEICLTRVIVVSLDVMNAVWIGSPASGLIKNFDG